MGLYSDLQTDISDAFYGDLLDATKTLTVTKKVVGAYDPALGTAPITKTVNTMRCVVVSDNVGEKLDEYTSTDEVIVLVLDSDKTVTTFDLGDGVNVDGSDYLIKGVGKDPAGVAHTIKCRKD